MQNWMQALAAHYETMRANYPQEDLLILFDIDGTILDIRYMMLYLLQAYDQHHDTAFFINRHVTDINFSAEELENGLLALGVDESHFPEIRHWYETHCWSMSALLESHRPFPGVMEVIRWFQMQPHTHVGLNTARPESLRGETLCSLNKLGREYRVHFCSDLLFMRSACYGDDVTGAKLDGIQYFRERGYRPVAMVDNQPLILEAVADNDPDRDILLLHAGTLFQSRPGHIPTSAVHGNVYDLTELIPDKALPRHIQFVWRDVNTERVLDEFLKSGIRWADLSMLARPYVSGNCLPDARNATRERQSQLFHDCLEQLKAHHRGVRIDLGADPAGNNRLIKILQAAGISSEDIWLHTEIEQFTESRFRHLAETHPGSIIEVPVDFLAPLLLNGTTLTEQMLDRLSDWGINRYALNWTTPHVRRLHDLLDVWGFENTIHEVGNLQDFLQAVLLTPTAICSDFNYPQWQPRTSGRRGVYGTDSNSLQLA